VHLEASLWGSKFHQLHLWAPDRRTCDADGDCVADDRRRLQGTALRAAQCALLGSEIKATVALIQRQGREPQRRTLGDYVRASLDRLGDVPRMPPYHIVRRAHLDERHVRRRLPVEARRRATAHLGCRNPRTAGFDNIDAHFLVHPLTDSSKLEIGVVGRNLSNSVQRNAVSINKDLVEMPGRDIRFVCAPGSDWPQFAPGPARRGPQALLPRAELRGATAIF